MVEPITSIHTRDTDTRVTILETQISGITQSLTKIEDRVETNYNTLHHRISELRDDLRNDFETKNEKILQKMDEHNENSLMYNQEIKDRIAHVEKWKWMIMGGAIVIGYVLAHIKLENLF